MISQSDLFKLFRMISRFVINCDECALRFYVCSIFVDRVFVLFIFHHGVHWTYKCFAYVAPRGWIWVRRGLCGFGDIRGSVRRYDPWGIKATGFAVTTKINHYAAVTSWGGVDVTICLGDQTVTEHCRVLDTDAFDIVIGTDFLRRNPHVKMLSLQRPYSLHCDFGSGLFSVPLELSG